MIRLLISIDKWKVTLLIVKDKYLINDILTELERVNCSYKCISEAIKTITEGITNIGFTFSNRFLMESVVIIGILESKYQLINTITHESRHLQLHIANTFNLDLNGEDVCYLIGEIVLKIYEVFDKNHLI